MADVRFFYISFFSEVFPEAVTLGNISGKWKLFLRIVRSLRQNNTVFVAYRIQTDTDRKNVA